MACTNVAVVALFTAMLMSVLGYSYHVGRGWVVLLCLRIVQNYQIEL